MGWREEIATALGELIAIMGGTGKRPRWQRIGRAIRTGEAGWYAVDIRSSDIDPDQLDTLKLAGPEPDNIETKGFSVAESVQNGSLLSLKVAAFADLTDPHLWMLKQPPTFLAEALRDGIAGMGEAPLASALAAGCIGGTSSLDPDPPGFHPAQGEAYRACLGQGIHLVWGPPGTGKTTVLKRAIGDLITRGERVLLVSATNIAVDNALLGVAKESRHSPGDIVRVGPPQLREVADNPEVSLPLMVRERLAETAERQSRIEAALVSSRARAAELAALDTALVRFDPAGYAAALKLLRTPDQDPVSLQGRAAKAAALIEEAVATRDAAQESAQEAEQRSNAAEVSRQGWSEVDRLRKEQSRVLKAADRKEADALMAEDYLRDLQEELGQLDARRSMARWRTREKRQELSEQIAAAEADAAREQGVARVARTTANAHITALEVQLTELIACIALTPQQIEPLEQALASARTTYKSALDLVTLRRRQAADVEQAVMHAKEAAALITLAEQQGWPARHTNAERLRPQVKADATERASLEDQFRQVQEEYERLARNAQGEIIKAAKLVATTLARFRTNKSVFEGPYDVVLVDEAGAATLPEVILATARATRTAGDPLRPHPGRHDLRHELRAHAGTGLGVRIPVRDRPDGNGVRQLVLHFQAAGLAVGTFTRAWINQPASSSHRSIDSRMRSSVRRPMLLIVGLLAT